MCQGARLDRAENLPLKPLLALLRTPARAIAMGHSHVIASLNAAALQEVDPRTLQGKTALPKSVTRTSFSQGVKHHSTASKRFTPCSCVFKMNYLCLS